jgi:hypothetical protein
MIELRLIAELPGSMSCGFAEEIVLGVGDLGFGECEGRDSHEVNGLFVVAAILLAHEELSGWDGSEDRGQSWRHLRS